MPTRSAFAGIAALAALAILAGCPGTSSVNTLGSDSSDLGTGVPTMRATIKPLATANPGDATSSASSSTTPTPTPAATLPPGRTGILSVTILNPIQQMWLPQSLADTAPNSIPSTYSFQVEVVVGKGQGVATSSSVVWSSSQPQYLIIDARGYASASVLPQVQTSQLVTLTAATSSGAATISTSIDVLVGNSGSMAITVE